MRMLIIVVLQLVCMKILVAVETYSGKNRLSAFQWAAFCLAWFGMRPVLFEKLPAPPLPFMQLLVRGVSRILMGVFLLYISLLMRENWHLERFFLSQLCLLAGLSLILHFGILNVCAAVWRMLGVDVSELFRSPYKSRSLKEFWGKRWNIAFAEMTALIAYRPLKGSIGPKKAVIASFLLSGLLHEIAISFPVMTGFGLPMIYFGIHAVAMQLEDSKFVQRILGHKVLSRVWVMAFVLVPLPLLFHAGFIQGVLIPLRTLICDVTLW